LTSIKLVQPFRGRKPWIISGNDCRAISCLRFTPGRCARVKTRGWLIGLSSSETQAIPGSAGQFNRSPTEELEVGWKALQERASGGYLRPRTGGSRWSGPPQASAMAISSPCASLCDVERGPWTALIPARGVSRTSRTSDSDSICPTGVMSQTDRPPL
jgi:hypothetical protein